MTAAFSSALESASASTPVAEAPSASTPETTTPATDPSAPAATTQAAAEPTPPASANPDPQGPEKKGEPPAWRWQDILENTRKSVKEETEARVKQEVEQQYQWAKELAANEQERVNLLAWYRKLNSDPVAAYRELQQAIEANPQYAAALKPQPAAPDPEPEPDLQNTDGTLVYSAPQLKKWQEWNAKRLMQQVQQQLQPIQHVAQTFQQREAQAAYTNTVASVIARMKAADPVFEKHTKDIADLITSDARLSKLALQDGDPETAIEIAWGRVYRTKVLPTLHQSTEQQVLANLQQRAVAGSVNPNAPSVTTPQKFKTGQQGFVEALSHFSGVEARRS